MKIEKENEPLIERLPWPIMTLILAPIGVFIVFFGMFGAPYLLMRLFIWMAGVL